LEDTLVRPNVDGIAYVLLFNPTGCSSHVAAGTTVGVAAEVQVVNRSRSEANVHPDKSTATVHNVTSDTDRKEKLLGLIEKPNLLNDRQTHNSLDSLLVTTLHLV